MPVAGSSTGQGSSLAKSSQRFGNLVDSSASSNRPVAGSPGKFGGNSGDCVQSPFSDAGGAFRSNLFELRQTLAQADRVQVD